MFRPAMLLSMAWPTEKLDVLVLIVGPITINVVPVFGWLAAPITLERLDR